MLQSTATAPAVELCGLAVATTQPNAPCVNKVQEPDAEQHRPRLRQWPVNPRAACSGRRAMGPASSKQAGRWHRCSHRRRHLAPPLGSIYVTDQKTNTVLTATSLAGSVNRAPTAGCAGWMHTHCYAPE